jgi:hypothetical protein
MAPQPRPASSRTPTPLRGGGDPRRPGRSPQRPEAEARSWITESAIACRDLS